MSFWINLDFWVGWRKKCLQHSFKRTAVQMGRPSQKRLRQSRRKPKATSPFGFWQIAFCVLAAFPLAFLYRQVLIPLLANLDLVRWAKSLSLDDVVHGIGGVFGLSASEVDSYASFAAHSVSRKLETVTDSQWEALYDGHVVC